MPAGYLIAEVEISDPDAYAAYREKALAAVAAHGGEFLVRGGRSRCLEGENPLPTLFIVKFASFEQALAWYHSQEYTRVKALREGAARANLVVVEGAE
jgi:uncharacterized protein (DUF1330 family)